MEVASGHFGHMMCECGRLEGAVVALKGEGRPEDPSRTDNGAIRGDFRGASGVTLGDTGVTLGSLRGQFGVTLCTFGSFEITLGI